MANVYDCIIVITVIPYFFPCPQQSKYFPTHVSVGNTTCAVLPLELQLDSADFSRFNILKLKKECKKKKKAI